MLVILYLKGTDKYLKVRLAAIPAPGDVVCATSIGQSFKVLPNNPRIFLSQDDPSKASLTMLLVEPVSGEFQKLVGDLNRFLSSV